VDVHIQGQAAHSSVPHEGLSAIDAVAEVVQRLKRLEWSDRHPLLGGRHAVVYKVRYEPLAPHTLPSDAYLAIDRRLLPGDDPAAATDEVRRAIGDLAPYHVEVGQGVYMLPALVDPDDPGVGALFAAHRAVTGREPARHFGQGSFDAGGPLSRGIPTVMYGASAGVGLTGVDFVPVSQVEQEARVLAGLIVNWLG
jgi:acetylornithine deacetylase/succinyl-diaminopimelate desuccinylase-like protein